MTLPSPFIEDSSGSLPSPLVPDIEDTTSTLDKMRNFFEEQKAQFLKDAQEQQQKENAQRQNIFKIIGSGFGLRNTPEAAQVRDAFSKGFANQEVAAKQTTDDILNMFGKVSPDDIKKKILSAFQIDNTKTSFGQRAESAGSSVYGFAKGLLDMPGDIAEKALNSSILPVDLSDPNMTPLSVDKQKEAQKATLGNIVMFTTAPMLEKAVGVALESGAKASLNTVAQEAKILDLAPGAKKTLANIAETATEKPAVGILGRTIIQDAVAGMGAGVAGMAVTSANTKDVVDDMFSGLLMGTVGVVAGYYRGVGKVGAAAKALEENRIDKLPYPERLQEEAKAVLYAHNTRLVTDRSALENKAKLEGLVTGDNILDAMIKSKFQIEPDGYVHLQGIANNGRQLLETWSPEENVFMPEPTPYGVETLNKISDAASALNRRFALRVEKDGTVSALIGNLTTNDIVGFENRGTLPQKVVTSTLDTEQVTSRKRQFLQNQVDVERNNNDAFSSATTGQPFIATGIRYQRGVPVGGTGVFYALSLSHAQRYAGKIGDNFLQLLQGLRVDDVKLNNPYVADNHYGLTGEIAAGSKAFAKLTVEQQKAMASARSILYDNSKHFAGIKEHAQKGVWNETGYQLTDRLIKQVLEQNGFDGIVYKASAEIVDFNRKVADNRDVFVEKKTRQITSHDGKDYEYVGTIGSGEFARLSDLRSGHNKLVPIEELRTVTQPAQILEPAKFYDNLYEQFNTEQKIDLAGRPDWFNNPTNDYQTELRKFLEIRGLSDRIEPISKEFARRIGAGGDNLDVILKGYESVLADERAIAHQTVGMANTNNMYLSENGSKIEIRSMEDSHLLHTAHTLQDAKAFINKAGQFPGDNLDAGMPIPTDAVSGLPPTPITLSDPLNQPYEHPEAAPQVGFLGRKSNIAANMIARFDTAFPWITSMNNFIDGIDKLFGTNIGYAYQVMQDKYRQSIERINSTLTRPEIKAFASSIKSLRPEIRAKLSGWLEAMSAPEIIKAYNLSKGAQDLAQEAVGNVDLHRVLTHRRLMEGALKEAQQRALQTTQQDKFLATQDFVNGIISKDELAAKLGTIEANAIASAPQTKYYLTTVKSINDAIKPDKAFMDMEARLSAYMNEVQGITRLNDALRDKNTHGLSRDEYAKAHGFNINDLAIAQTYEKLLQDFGKEYIKNFGVDGHKVIPHYVSHFRKYGDPILGSDISAGFALKGPREFAAQLIRTGEVSVYMQDPLQVLQSYIRAGVKAAPDGFYEHADKMQRLVTDEINKIPDTEENRKVRQDMVDTWHDLDNVMSGRNTMDAARINALWKQYYKNIGMRPEDIDVAINKPGALGNTLALMNSSLMGGRLVMAARDAYDAISKFYIFHGAERTTNFLKLAFDRDAMRLAKETGIVKTPGYASIYTSNQIDKVSNVAHNLAEWGFKTSGQGFVNELVQLGAHTEAVKFHAPLFRDYAEKFAKAANDAEKKKLLDNVQKKMFFNSYDEHVKKTVLANLGVDSEGGFTGKINTQAATDAVAKASRDRIAGTFGAGAGTRGSTSAMGRLFGQMGSWSMQNRSILLKALAKGDRQELLGVWRRYLTSQGALMAAGGITGLNFSNWMMGPQNIMFTGGPLFQLGGTIPAAIGAQLGGSDTQKEYTMRQMKRIWPMFIPFGYNLRGLVKANELYEGTGYGPGRIVAEAFGLPAKQGDDYQSYWDIYNNNWPSVK